jgi:hypothetical protein
MQDIKLELNGNVTVKMVVTGRVIWKCFYHSTDTNRNTSDYSLNSSNNNYDIGSPDSLIGCYEDWIVRIANSGDEEQKYTVKLEWIQNTKVIRTWSPGDDLRLKGNSTIHEDSTFFVK